ncbi:MAG: DUF4142 domain-containing protein [Gemmatimonadaceae bacterium]
MTIRNPRRLARPVGGLLALAVAASLACGDRHQAPADSSNPAMAPAAAMRDSVPATPTALSDAQIAKIVMVANANDSAGGALAATKATAADVKAFGRTMVRDHGMLNKSVTDLATKLSLTAENSDASTRMEQDGKDGLSRLQTLSGAEFDRAYIDQEVAGHEKVLNELNETLIPAAQNAELKTLLNQAKGAVSGHLERAKALQKTHSTTSE